MASRETLPFTRFMMSASRPEQFPPEDGLPEAAFLGRSNVGKSSLMNALVKTGERESSGRPAGGNKMSPEGSNAGKQSAQKRQGLAFTSRTPGRTQLINFYQIGDLFRFADLPGYGYAQVPQAMLEEWRQLIERYLVDRESLRLCLLLLDARRGWMDKDRELRHWLEVQGRPFMVAVTKIDKLSQSEQHRAMSDIRKECPDGELHPCSAVTGRGVRELWQAIWKIKNQ